MDWVGVIVRGRRGRGERRKGEEEIDEFGLENTKLRVLLKLDEDLD